MERSPDHADSINYIGHAGSAQSKPPFHVIEPAYSPCRIASHAERRGARRAKSAHCFHCIRADPKDDGIALKKLIVEIAELRDFNPSTVCKGPDVEEEGYVLSPVLGEGEVPARTEGH